jgi:hypothetical protein
LSILYILVLAGRTRGVVGHDLLERCNDLSLLRLVVWRAVARGVVAITCLSVVTNDATKARGVAAYILAVYCMQYAAYLP